MSEATRARHGRAWMPVVVVVALFVLVVVAAALQGAAGFEPRFAPEAVEPPAAVPGASEGPSVAPEPEDVPDVVIDPGPDPTLGAVTAIVIAGLVAVAVVALRRALRGMRTRARPTAAEVDITTSFAASPTADADVGAVREGIDEAIERIETPGAARDAVVAAWAELEAAAAAAGLARAASETQAEFAVRVLGRVHAAESTVALLRIYEGVRYGGRTPTAADVNAARGHLQVIRQVWR
jgi:hypothetical protein